MEYFGVLLLLLCSQQLLLTVDGAAAASAVLDVDGNEVQRGQLYYALSAKTPGGLTLASLDDDASSCPLYVAQAGRNDFFGQPLAFTPENQRADVVGEGSTLYITFPRATQCPNATMWKYNYETNFVSTGGSPSTAIGPHLSRFAIRKAEDRDGSHSDYQLQVCPCSLGSGLPSCRMGCLGSLGLADERGKNLLGLRGDHPHTIAFVRVKEQEQPSMIRSALMRPN